MHRSGARAAIAPLAASPARLSLAGAAVVLAVFLIQYTSGVSPWGHFAPVELSSNIVALAGLVWTLIELRAHWGERRLRAAWAAATIAMAMLAVDGDLDAVLPIERWGPANWAVTEMGLSIVTWLVAAGLLFWAARRFSARGIATPALGLGLGLQAIAQYAGWLSVSQPQTPTGAEVLEYLNDIGELAATLAYLVALLVAEFSPAPARGAAEAAGSAAQTSAPSAARAAAALGHRRAGAEIVSFLARRSDSRRFAAAGIAFPPVYRVAGFSWRERPGEAPWRAPHLAYVFGDADLSGVEEAERAPFARPDPALDDGWVVVRRHASHAAAAGYLAASAELSDENSPPAMVQTATASSRSRARPVPERRSPC
ncbi:hypothetical protein [Chenggangzhangella methanolivorans]|uniref:Uncharacterized protein n=1 Tax=Chenggangzhangella methanolivorans TaxID=1437009 RepID=A0A9E6RAR4_9HYPH|nr:hypothetical protein [Chenggangzhangella methanolivorans]QZO01319.1 hypothetical protein K6K41_07440 [Chenggangzhangella methanolivorans]